MCLILTVWDYGCAAGRLTVMFAHAFEWPKLEPHPTDHRLAGWVSSCAIYGRWSWSTESNLFWCRHYGCSHNHADSLSIFEHVHGSTVSGTSLMPVPRHTCVTKSGLSQQVLRWIRTDVFILCGANPDRRDSLSRSSLAAYINVYGSIVSSALIPDIIRRATYPCSNI